MSRHPSIRILAGCLALLTLIAALYGPAVTASSGDAGTGADAGDSQAEATPVDYRSYMGLLSPGDVDWYSHSEQSAIPRCVTATWTAWPNTTATLAADTFTGSQSVVGNARAGTTSQLILAVNSARTTYFGIQNAPEQARFWGAYNFTWNSVATPPTAAGDAGSGMDAGDSISSALPIGGSPCTGGHFALTYGVADVKDVYAVTIASAGNYLVSLGANDNAVALSVVDAAGNVLAGPITPGHSTSVSFPSSGTYYMSASRTSLGPNDIGYMIGILGGPPVCQPTC